LPEANGLFFCRPAQDSRDSLQNLAKGRLKMARQGSSIVKILLKPNSYPYDNQMQIKSSNNPMKSFTFLTENRKQKTENRIYWTEDFD
jgi:hypothetical protein